MTGEPQTIVFKIEIDGDVEEALRRIVREEIAAVSITDAAGSPVRVLARADDEPLDHGAAHYSTKVEAAPESCSLEFGL